MRSMSKKEAQEKFVWFNKQSVSRSKCQSKADISISKRNGCTKKDGSISHKIAFIFRNKTFEKITKTGYIEFAIYKNRIMFREGDEQTGLKGNVDKSTSGSSVEIVLGLNETTQELDDFVMLDYDLEYDGFYEVYYVERKVNER